MKAILLILTLFIYSTTQGQSLKKLNVFCTEKFDPKSSITVEGLDDDPCLATDALKNSLIINGFKVISERVAKEKIELINKGQTSDTTFNQEISSGKTTYLKSVYVITLNYNFRRSSGCGGIVISTLAGQVVDLANDGEIVATFSFKQGLMEIRCTSTVMEALAKELKTQTKSKK